MDEAGRGPLAGPVVAAAVILPAGAIIDGVMDSKTVSEKNRRIVFWRIVREAVGIGLGIVEADEIDRINILNSTKKAMLLAVDDLGIRPSLLLVDAVKLPHNGMPTHSMIKGESVSASIAAASIVAKVVRDDIMYRYDKAYPGYGFGRHKGYGTKDHMRSLLKLGPSPVHRKTFRGVMDQSLPME